MSEKDIDERHFTRKGQIRIETWVTVHGAVERYNLAYINAGIHSGDNARVFGFDNAHLYPGFDSEHHMHWFGHPLQGKPFVSFEETLRRFERMLVFFKRHYRKSY